MKFTIPQEAIDELAASSPDSAIRSAAKFQLATIEKEIAWNERRLENLVLGDGDKKQTEDLVADLREERQRILGALDNG